MTVSNYVKDATQIAIFEGSDLGDNGHSYRLDIDDAVNKFLRHNKDRIEVKDIKISSHIYENERVFKQLYTILVIYDVLIPRQMKERILQ